MRNYDLDFKAAAEQLRAPMYTFNQLVDMLGDKYSIKHRDGLLKVLSDIRRPGWTGHPTRKFPSLADGTSAAAEFKRHWEAVQLHAAALLDIASLMRSGGLALAALDIVSPQRASEVSQAVHLISEVRPRLVPLNPYDAMLRGLLFILIYYAREQPTLKLTEEPAGVPELFTTDQRIAEFIVDALAVTEWSFTIADIMHYYPNACAAVNDQRALEDSENPDDRYESREKVDINNRMSHYLASEYFDQARACLDVSYAGPGAAVGV